MVSDAFLALRFWAVLFLIGACSFPLTKVLFRRFWDNGYMLSKAVGLAMVTYVVWLLASLRVLPFSNASILLTLAGIFLLGTYLSRKAGARRGRNPQHQETVSWKVVLVEELVFLAAFLFWSWVKAHEPSIHALEKFMDYGFTKSVLDSRFFPPPDMWYAGGTINYYYFGHVVMAMLTRLSGIDLAYTFNFMLAALFALTLTMSFTIGVAVFRQLSETADDTLRIPRKPASFIAGGLTAFLTTLAGNMQTIYAFTKGYTGEDVKPFWELAWKAGEFWTRLPEGLERYWYANATRFIPFTIHEFPGYSFVVSDVHGHVLSLPFALLAIAFLFSLFGWGKSTEGELPNGQREWPLLYYARYVVFGLLIAVLFMTNALDGPIYGGLFFILLYFDRSRYESWSKAWFTEKGERLAAVLIAGPAVIPFLIHFKSFVNGVAVNCPPQLFANSSLGPILFESVEKCQHSPFWMLYLLWGFFWFSGLWFLHDKIHINRDRFPYVSIKGAQIEIFFSILFLYSVLLIIFPEFFYFKDIYPAHFRSNTMFKLGYQAFLMYSLVSGVVIVRTLFQKVSRKGFPPVLRRMFVILLVPQLFLVSIFPIFAVRSYFNSLRVYEGINGTTWLANEYPDDYAAIRWLNSRISDGSLTAGTGTPVIVEAEGDSYTDYAHVSAFTGLPTVIGWAVHEWLWRGTYDIVSPRREDVRQIYEDPDVEYTRKLLYTYGVRYVFVGTLERDRYSQLNEAKFRNLGSLVFQSNGTRIYAIR